MEINIPEDDYFYKKFNVRCQDFVRAFPGVQPNCKLGKKIGRTFSTLIRKFQKLIIGILIFGNRFKKSIQHFNRCHRWKYRIRSNRTIFQVTLAPLKSAHFPLKHQTHAFFVFLHIRQLRAGHGGLLKMNPAFAEFGLNDLLPMKTDIPDEGCARTNHSQFCFLAGKKQCLK